MKSDKLKVIIYFAIGMQNLFCEGNWSAKFILRRLSFNWSAKFILRRQLECKIYFAKAEGMRPYVGAIPCGCPFIPQIGALALRVFETFSP